MCHVHMCICVWVCAGGACTNSAYGRIVTDHKGHCSCTWSFLISCHAITLYCMDPAVQLYCIMTSGSTAATFLVRQLSSTLRMIPYALHLTLILWILQQTHIHTASAPTYSLSQLMHNYVMSCKTAYDG